MLRRAIALVAPVSPRGPADRLISPRELRTFLGEPKQRQWKALLERAGIRLSWKRIPGRRGKHRRGLTRAQVLKVMSMRYAAIGELRIRRWRIG